MPSACTLKVKKGEEGDEVLPVLWEDNYFALLPGESREVAAGLWIARSGWGGGGGGSRGLERKSGPGAVGAPAGNQIARRVGLPRYGEW